MELITRRQALKLFESPMDELLSAADDLRRRFRKDHFDLCTIINAKSGSCSENCRFCSQSSHYMTFSETYPLLAEEDILEDARKNESQGVRRSVIFGRFAACSHQKTLPR